MKNGLELHPYKIVMESLLSDDQKIKLKYVFCKLDSDKSSKRRHLMRILFSNEKFFDINGIYNSQNGWAWAVSRADADKKGGIQQRQKFPHKVTIWVGACPKNNAVGDFG